MKSIVSSTQHDRFVSELEAIIVGRTARVERREADWAFLFDPDFAISIATLWRLIDTTHVCVTSQDDGHRFGLPAPVDAAEKANSLLSGKAVDRVEVDSRTGDLRVHFQPPLTLEFVTTSSGYESWQMYHFGEFFAFGASGGNGWFK